MQAGIIAGQIVTRRVWFSGQRRKFPRAEPHDEWSSLTEARRFLWHDVQARFFASRVCHDLEDVAGQLNDGPRVQRIDTRIFAGRLNRQGNNIRHRCIVDRRKLAG